MSPQIRLSIKGLVKFMTGNATNQRKTLESYKYPDEEAKAQRDYYRDARNAVVSFLRENHPVDWLKNRAENIDFEARSADSKRATRLRHNSRAIRQFADHFGALKLIFERKHPPLYFTSNGVRISCSPDLVVKYRGRTKFVKIEFGKDEIGGNDGKIMTQTIFEALVASGSPSSGSDVMVWDVASGKMLRGARVGARRRKEIENACKNIVSLWPSI